ncbi:MAG: histidine kinase [Bacteroidota bacterium]
MKAKYRQLLLWHFIFYIIYYIFQSAAKSGDWSVLEDYESWADVFHEAAMFIATFIYTAGTYWIASKYRQSGWSIIVSLTVLNSLLGISFRYITQEVISWELFEYRNYNPDLSLLYYYVDNIYYVILHSAVGLVFFFNQYTQVKEQQASDLVIENQQTQLAYLRAQINPHFLFNTLNNIYSLVYQKSDNALKSVEKLTALLRYGLYEQSEQVGLEKEIEHIYNFIELERMRYDFPITVDFDITLKDKTMQIPPFLLIPFVENAFKHGDVRAPIKIELKTLDQQLSFQVSNRIKVKQKDAVGGIGLENIRKRLALIYDDQYHFEISKEENHFEIKLQLI